MTSIERRDTDTSKSYAALCAYAAMGAGRSLEKLVQHWANDGPTKHLSVLKGWSAKYDWQRRIAVYDQAIIDAEERAYQELRTARRRELAERDWVEGSALRTFVQDALKEAPKFLRRTENEVRANGETVKVITLALAAGPGELARAMKLASEIQRLSVGEPTEIHRIVERELEAFFDVLARNLTEDEYARIVDLAGGTQAGG